MTTTMNTHRRRAINTAFLSILVVTTAACGKINHTLNGNSLNDRYRCNTEVKLQTPLTIEDFAKATKPEGDDLHSWERLIIERSAVYGKARFKKGDVLLLPKGCGRLP